MSNSGITVDLIVNAELQAPPQTYYMNIPEVLPNLMDILRDHLS